MNILAYLILGLMIIIVPMTITILYTRILYKNKEDATNPMIIFMILLGIEILYLLYLYFTKMK